MIFIRYCKKCGEAYDIGINFDTCPSCRLKKLKENMRKFEVKDNAQQKIA